MAEELSVLLMCEFNLKCFVLGMSVTDQDMCIHANTSVHAHVCMYACMQGKNMHTCVHICTCIRAWNTNIHMYTYHMQMQTYTLTLTPRFFFTVILLLYSICNNIIINDYTNMGNNNNNSNEV